MKVSDIQCIKTFGTTNPKDTRYLNHVIYFDDGTYNRVSGRFCSYNELWRYLNEVCS